MADSTARFDLPFIMPGQAGKEITHNEALVKIDALLHPNVEAFASTTPEAPLLGQCWLVASGATGDWVGKEEQVAVWSDGGWRFVPGKNGMQVWDKAEGYFRIFSDEGWSGGLMPAAGLSIGGKQVVGERRPPVLNPSGGTIIDAEARAAITQISAALMSHGLIG